MSAAARIALAALALENADLFAPLIFKYLGRNGSTIHEGTAELESRTFTYGQYLVDGDTVAGLRA